MNYELEELGEIFGVIELIENEVLGEIEDEVLGEIEDVFEIDNLFKCFFRQYKFHETAFIIFDCLNT